MKSNDVMDYREAEGREDLQVGGMRVHTFQGTGGIDRVLIREHALFLVESDVTTTEVWNGVSQGQYDWRKGDLAFLPAGTELSSPYVSQVYDEDVIRLSPAGIMTASEQVGVPASMDLRYFMIPRNHVYGISQSIVRLAKSSQQRAVFPMLTEALEQSLYFAVACSISDVCGKTIKPSISGLSEARRHRSLEFIESNLSRHISLADIASAAAMSPHHFNRSFRVTMGVSPVRYVWARRVALAKVLLRDRRTPIAEVALSCGFANQSHFTTAFRMGTGATPGEYRKAIVGAMAGVVCCWQRALATLETVALV